MAVFQEFPVKNASNRLLQLPESAKATKSQSLPVRTDWGAKRAISRKSHVFFVQAIALCYNT